MAKFKGKNKNFNAKNKGRPFAKKSVNFIKTRREIRKDERQKKKNDKVKAYLKRVKKSKDHFEMKAKSSKTNTDKKGEDSDTFSDISDEIITDGVADRNEKEGSTIKLPLSDVSKDNLRSKRVQMSIEKKMKKQRLEALKEANIEEDKIISGLEKQLKLNKRKSKSLPASFTSCGLDYILDVCNPDKMKDLAETEKYFQDSDSEFEDDLAIVKGKSTKKKNKKPSEDNDALCESKQGSDGGSDPEDRSETESDENDFSDDSLLNDLQGDDESDSDLDSSNFSMDEETKSNTVQNSKLRKRRISEGSNSDEEQTKLKIPKTAIKKEKKISFEEPSASIEESSMKNTNKSKLLKGKGETKESLDEKLSDLESDLSDAESHKDDDLAESKNKNSDKDETWQDIYGRIRDKKGNVIESTKGKYVPPALRAKALSDDAQKREALERLQRLLKGLMNRLAESNMHSIANQIEDLYMKNSRNDMNQTIMSLYTEAVVSPVRTPDRLIMEHAMLTAILHANIGTEVGAYILQTFVTNFDKLLHEGTEIGDKRLDNLLTFICHLYTFKIFDNRLLYDILGVLCDKFTEKEIELIMVVLRNSGFSLRKDDPLALKELVFRVQRLASQASQLKNDSRVNFMLDVLLKIKNNNMSKLPQYDPSHSEHLKKIIKAMIRKGNCISELKISLEDLLKADERGRWWIVGSAWTGPGGGGEQSKEKVSASSQVLLPAMSEQLSQLAKKLRINTDVRKNIFCILMTAEDYDDAFEKLLKLGLKGQTMNEIIHVLLHCLLQEKEYNHYYSLIANRFAQTDRKYRMIVQYALWDKFKGVEAMKSFQVTNLAKFLAFLFIEGTMPLSVLKVIQLVEMTKGNVRLIRQILLSILYHKDETVSAAVFLRLTKSTQLHLFREGLRLFLHHFLLKNMKETDKDFKFLKERITMADKALQPQAY